MLNMKKSALCISAALAVFSTSSHAGWTSSEVDFGGLKAYVYTPGAAAPAAGRPLFITLHGCGQKDSDIIKSNLGGMADKYNAIVVVPAVGHGVIASCWDYGNTGSTPNMLDAASIVKGTKAAIANSTYKIDPNQVYISGISSGGAYAMAVGCANPDLYAGIGSAAGPTVGSSQGSAMSGTGDATTMANWCKKQAAGKEEFFKTQLWAQTYGAELPSSDGLCSPKFIEPNHKAAQLLLGLTGGADHEKDIKFTGATAGNTGTAENEHYIKDANGAKRIALIEVPGMQHNWPGGTGSTGSYVSTKFDFGLWMAANFTENNCRMAANKGKPQCGVADGKVTGLACTVTKDSVSLTWKAPAGVTIDGYSVKNATLNASQKTTATSLTWTNLNKGTAYTFTAAATAGGITYPESDAVTCTPDTISPPSGLAATPAAKSVQLSWTAVSGATKYNIYRNGTGVGSATTTSYADNGPLTTSTTYEYCATAVNGLNEESARTCVSTKTLPDAVAVSDTCTYHYINKRLDVNGYLACGKKYGYINKVSLYQCSTGWTDQASCAPRSF
ncbi:MAG: depolymerase family esterase [Proteobacteria bacterium]|nr:depolymerase family esterase [Pseudomonadota bacterium]